MKIKIDGKEVEIKAEDIVSITADEIPENIKSELGGLDDSKVKEYLETKEGQKLIQPQIDSAVTKGIQTFTENNKDKFKKEGMDEIKTELQKQVDEANQKLTSVTMESKLQKQLLNEGLNPKRIELALRLTDTSKLSLDGDNLLGATDLIGSLKEQVPEFFGESEPPKGKGTTGEPPAGGQASGTDNSDPGLSAFMEGAGITE